MRFWITRNGEVPIREQLVRQTVLGILSQDLAPGARLPSVRAMARRHRIHANTVSAAWHDLLDQGWLELRRGSGLYVRGATEASPLHELLRSTLDAANRLGHHPDEVLRQLSAMVHPRPSERVLVAEPDPAMREILLAELREALTVPVEILQTGSQGLIVALTTRVAKLRRSGIADCFTLKLRSIDAALGEPGRVPEGFLISIVSRSREILDSSRAILIAIGAQPDAVQQVDAREDGWRDRLSLSGLIVTDVVMASQLPPGHAARVFRVIADSSITELRQIVTPKETATA
jgi:DNA-binding transcriptional regulator YhcF (GntR family)